MISSIPPHSYSYKELWDDNINFYYLILLSFSSTFSINIIIPLDVIKYILIIYLRYEIHNIPPHLKCPCDLISCQRKWITLEINHQKNKRRSYLLTDSYIKEEHCFTKNCHNIYKFNRNYMRRCISCPRNYCYECQEEFEHDDDCDYYCDYCISDDEDDII